MMDDICLSLTSALDRLARFQRRFFPPAVSGLRQDLVPGMNALNRAREKAEKISGSDESGEAPAVIIDTIDLTLQTLKIILEAPKSDLQQTIFQVMRSSRKICRVQETLHGIRGASSVLDRFFLEPGGYDPVERFQSH